MNNIIELVILFVNNSHKILYVATLNTFLFYVGVFGIINRINYLLTIMAIGTLTISFYKQIDIVTNIALVFWILIIFVIFFIHLLKIWVQLNQNKRVNIFLLDSPIIFFGLNGILNTLFSLNLNEFSLIPEFFLGFSSLMVSIYFSLVAYNKGIHFI